MATPLTVQVSSQFSLSAGTWEECVNENQEAYRLVTPPPTPMYEQLIGYLMAETKEYKTPPQSSLDFEEVAIATVAVCIRWGSYFAVLNRSELPLWFASENEEVSCIGDAEMARMNIEMSAALANWLRLIDVDNKLFRKLVKAALQLLPVPPLTFDTATHAREFRTLTFFNSKKGREELLLSLKQRLGEQFVEQQRQKVSTNPLRSLANGMLLETWRNGPIEDIHAGGIYLPRPLTQRRIHPAAEQMVLSETAGRLVPILHALYRIITKKSEETLEEKILAHAILFRSPYNWSMTQQTQRAELPDPEP